MAERRGLVSYRSGGANSLCKPAAVSPFTRVFIVVLVLIVCASPARALGCGLLARLTLPVRLRVPQGGGGGGGGSGGGGSSSSTDADTGDVGTALVANGVGVIVGSTVGGVVFLGGVVGLAVRHLRKRGFRTSAPPVEPNFAGSGGQGAARPAES